MTGSRFEFSLTGDPVLETLGRMADSLDDLTPLMDQIGAALVNSAAVRIRTTNETPEGTPRAQSQRARAEGGPTLHDSGALARGINHWAAPDHVMVGTNTAYAAVMQHGAEQGAFGFLSGRTKPSEKRPRSQDYFYMMPWGDIPARPFLGVSEEDEEEVLGLAKTFLAEVVSGLAG